jgi:CRP/FNR family cyclic AMP-dependent transcriptional regulator
MNAKIENSPQPKVHGPSGRPIEIRINEHPFLNGMNSHQYRILTDCAMASHFDSGELIFGEGDPADRFYLIEKGSVILESYVKGKGMTRIQTIGVGEVLGWSWLFPPYFWHFNARALEPVDAIVLHAAPLRQECESDQEFGYELVKRMATVMLTRLQATRRELLFSGGALTNG